MIFILLIQLDSLKGVEDKIISIDVPSGWDIHQGNVHGSFYPACNISLTSVKHCMKDFSGTHYFAGNFVPHFIYKVSILKLLEFIKEYIFDY